MIKKNNPIWKLDYLYKSYKDTRIEKDINLAVKESTNFKSRFSTKLKKGKLSTTLMLKAIKEYEAISTKALIPASYVSNLHNVDMNNNELTALLGKINIKLSQLARNLSFFENELSRLKSEDSKKLLESNSLLIYRNWLNKVFSMKKHLLSADLEELIIEKDINGINSWKSFRSIYESKYTFMFKAPEDRKKREYSLTELTKLAEHKNRSVRHRAVETYLSKFKEDSYIYAHIYNSIIQDLILIDKARRNYDPLISQRNLTSQLDDNVVSKMHEVVEDSYSTAQRYWKLKSKILKIKDFCNADVRARYITKGKSLKKYTYNQGLSLLQETYDSFYKPFGSAFKQMYKLDLVHAKIQKGKRGGAYCSFFPNPLPPVVLINYQGALDDVSTLAHEAGHWIHGYLMSKKQTLLNMEIPMATAETASIFNEILFTARLLEEKADKNLLIELLMAKLDGIMATVFRQTAFSLFEQAAFKASERGPLTPKHFSDLFLETYGKLFSKAVKLTPNFKYEWARIPHFMSPFYVYSYAFGELATISLYKKYLTKQKDFPIKYMDFLSAGSSLTPYELFKKLDVDINKKDTWTQGIKYIDELINELENLL